MQRFFLLAFALFFSASSDRLFAADFYWDSNGATPGAGLTPTGTWGTSAFWSPDSTGASATGAWVSGSGAIFSAGTDATSLFVVTINTAQTANLLTIEEGIVSFEGSNAVALGASPITVAPGATLST